MNKKEFTDDQLACMRELSKIGARCIARDMFGRIYLYKSYPTKDKSYWSGLILCEIPSSMFPQIIWGDKNPICVDDYIKSTDIDPADFVDRLIKESHGINQEFLKECEIASKEFHFKKHRIRNKIKNILGRDRVVMKQKQVGGDNSVQIGIMNNHFENEDSKE